MAYESWARTIPRDSIFLLGQDEYEYQNDIGLYRAQREIYLPDEVDAIGRDQSPESLAAHLVACGAAEEIEYDAHHLGSYGKLDPKIFCRHEKRTPEVFPHPDSSTHPHGAIMDVCDACETYFPDTERPATERRSKQA